MSENEGKTPDPAPKDDGEEITITKSEWDRVIGKARQEERRKASEKYKDYDDLKVKAGEKQTLEERIAEMEQQTERAVATALRSDIAAEFGISKEDRDLFLLASDEDTLRAQAKRLADRDAERKKSLHVPKEGNVTDPVNGDDKEFVRQLFGRE